jgi:hypothetical protein
MSTPEDKLKQKYEKPEFNIVQGGKLVARKSGTFTDKTGQKRTVKQGDLLDKETTPKKWGQINPEYDTGALGGMFLGAQLGAEAGKGEDPMFRLGAVLGGALRGLFDKDFGERVKYDKDYKEYLAQTAAEQKIDSMAGTIKGKTLTIQATEARLQLGELKFGNLVDKTERENNDRIIDTYASQYSNGLVSVETINQEADKLRNLLVTRARYYKNASDNEIAEIMKLSGDDLGRALISESFEGGIEEFEGMFIRKLRGGGFVWVGDENGNPIQTRDGQTRQLALEDRIIKATEAKLKADIEKLDVEVLNQLYGEARKIAEEGGLFRTAGKDKHLVFKDSAAASQFKAIYEALLYKHVKKGESKVSFLTGDGRQIIKSANVFLPDRQSQGPSTRTRLAPPVNTQSSTKTTTPAGQATQTTTVVRDGEEQAQGEFNVNLGTASLKPMPAVTANATKKFFGSNGMVDGTKIISVRDLNTVFTSLSRDLSAEGVDKGPFLSLLSKMTLSAYSPSQILRPVSVFRAGNQKDGEIEAEIGTFYAGADTKALVTTDPSTGKVSSTEIYEFLFQLEQDYEDNDYRKSESLNYLFGGATDTESLRAIEDFYRKIDAAVNRNSDKQESMTVEIPSKNRVLRAIVQKGEVMFVFVHRVPVNKALEKVRAN